MIPEEDLLLGELRNLEVDQALILPINTNIRLIINSDDVIHS
jgi:heme/copper-type cytochrome/quinol oxidase subunit 2